MRPDFGFDIRDLVSGAVEASAPQAKARQLQLKRSVHSHLPHSLHGNSAGISRILTEVIANAVRYNPHHGEVCVRADLEDESDAEVTVRFSVTTAYQGVSVEAMAIVDALGGEICMEPRPGRNPALSLVVSLGKAGLDATRGVVLH